MNLPEEIRSICFTGHRELSGMEKKITAIRLSKLLTKLANEHGLLDCYAGGAIGFDTLAALSVLSLKKRIPNLKLHLILPCEGQEKSWSEEQKTAYYMIKEQADSVRTLSPFFYNGCMQIRNRELLEHADLCIAYLRPSTASGGSLNTVLQATKMGIPIINLADKESEDI